MYNIMMYFWETLCVMMSSHCILLEYWSLTCSQEVGGLECGSLGKYHNIILLPTV